MYPSPVVSRAIIGLAWLRAEVLCSIVAGFLHYFFLASFAWMCLEGVQLYVLLVEVFEAEKSRVSWYYLSAYGRLPASVMLLTFILLLLLLVLVGGGC